MKFNIMISKIINYALLMIGVDLERVFLIRWVWVIDHGLDDIESVILSDI